MKRFLFMTALLITTMTTNAATEGDNDALAFMYPGAGLFFQFGMLYSEAYGNIIAQYDTHGIAPGVVFGENAMTRFGYDYNLSNNIGLEFAFSDNGIDYSGHSDNQIIATTTDENYNFDIYNLESAVVFKNGFADLNSEIHAKFGLAYTYGKQTISYHTSTNNPPSWTQGQQQYYQQFHASGIAPLFDFGMSWSANQYIAYAFDYERVFQPVMGDINYGDPLHSQMQATNMWLFGVFYHF